MVICPNILNVSTRKLKNIFKLNHPYDANNIKIAIESGKVNNAVIVGGGLIGLEVAEDSNGG
jgi:NADPH-dependent 2,4-dienoyl-CoA reductase/sulfur reductase-like enzyme